MTPRQSHHPVLPTIRPATPDDAAAILAIYRPVVQETAISLEWAVPTLMEVQGRISTVLADGFPWLVAADDGDVIAYAYASRFRSRTAYDWTAEVSVYVSEDRQRRGTGRAIYGRLLRVLGLQGFHSAYGFATAPNPGSEKLHRSLGFTEVGRFSRVGYKFDKWHDVICWYKPLRHGSGIPGTIRPLSEALAEVE